MSVEKQIEEWLNGQWKWIQDAFHTINCKGSFNDKDVAGWLCTIKAIGESKPETKSPSKIVEITDVDAQEIRLHSIGPVEGIDALAPRHPLTFGDGNLTIVYGANGSGKSGYTRILCNACGKPHRKTLKENFFKEEKIPRKCHFSYLRSGEKVDLEWHPEDEPVADLAVVDIFDSTCGRAYLETSQEVSYQLPVLAQFATLVEACRAIDDELRNEEEKLVKKLPAFPVEYSNTNTCKAFNSLSSNTGGEGIRNLVSWKPKNEERLSKLRKQLGVTDPASAAKGKRQAKVEADAIKLALESVAAALGKEFMEMGKTLSVSAAKKRKVAEESVKALGVVAELDGLGTETWRAMWSAAEAYSTSEAYKGDSFPNTEAGSRCVLCHQELGESAGERLQKFQTFICGEVEKTAAHAENELEEWKGEIPKRPGRDELITRMSAAQLSEAIQKRVVAAWETAEVELDKLRDGKLSEVPAGVHILLKEVIGSLISLKNELSSEADALDKSSKLEGRATIAEELRNLEARKWVAGQADAVTAEVKRLVELERIKLFRKQTTTTGISKKAGVLSEELITEAYVDRFNQELSSLGAKHLRVELVKSGTTQGKMKHKVQLKTLGKDKVKIPDILSEGEQRIVALAAFLADVTGRTCIAPFVFDDPISSLDQKFEERVIRRLVRLSEERQVIIFTHRLSFLSIMSDVAGKTLHDVHIRREPWGAGEPGQVPMFGKRPDKALKNLIGERVPKAKNLWDTEGSETYYPFAKAICSDFRILMERIVETIFLADVVVRHRRAVNTMGKIDNLAKITHEDCKVIGDVMAKYSCYEHSQSDEAPVEVPDPNELEADIQSVIVWLNDFQKRR